MYTVVLTLFLRTLFLLLFKQQVFSFRYVRQ